MTENESTYNANNSDKELISIRISKGTVVDLRQRYGNEHGQILWNKVINTALDVRPENSKVDNPSHYTGLPNGVHCIDVVEHFDFIVGNIIKYAWRAGLKPGESKLNDLQKCLWYAQRAVDIEEEESALARSLYED